MSVTGDAVGRQGSRAFVGRDWEVAELVAGLEDAAGGRGRLFLIAGEPGIGKTWLAEDVAGRAIERKTRVLWGRCWEGGGAPPFWPWAQVISAFAEGCDDAALSAYLGAGAGSIAKVVPSLAERLGTTAVPPAAVGEFVAARFYLFEAVQAFFKRAAAAQPLLLIFDCTSTAGWSCSGCSPSWSSRIHPHTGGRPTTFGEAQDGRMYMHKYEEGIHGRHVSRRIERVPGRAESAA